MIERLITDLGHSLGHWAYLLVAFWRWPRRPRSSASSHRASSRSSSAACWPARARSTSSCWSGSSWVSCVIGDSIGFYLGRRLGRELGGQARARRCGSPRSAWHKVEAFFDRHGGKAIVIGRWVGLRAPADALHRRHVGHRATGASSPTTSSARACGEPRSRCSATSSGRASARSRASPSRAALAFGVLVGGARRLPGGQAAAQSRGSRPRRRLVRAPGRSGRCCGRSRAVVALGVWRYVLRPLWRLIAPPLRFVIDAAAARAARDRVHDRRRDLRVSVYTCPADRADRGRHAHHRATPGAAPRARHRDGRADDARRGGELLRSPVRRGVGRRATRSRC